MTLTENKPVILVINNIILSWILFNVGGAFLLFVPRMCEGVNKMFYSALGLLGFGAALHAAFRVKPYSWRKIDPQAPRCSTVIGLRKKVRIYK